MKKEAFILFVLLVTANFFQIFAQNPGDNIFSETKVYSVKFQFDQPNYWDSLVIYYNQGNEQYMSATITINDEVFPNCGVRLKGNSSFSHPNNKKSIRISFDEYISTQRWDGLKNIHLNNVYGDPSFLREKIYLDFCKEAGVHAPRANYANVFINDTLFAFYTLIEHIDKRFLGSHYGNNSGDLFKAADAFEGVQASSDFRWYTSIPDSYYVRYEFKTDESTTGWANLIRLLDTLNNNSNIETALPTVMNLNSFYNAIATDILFANLDSYSNSGRNFYFYFHPVTGKMEWIIWDVGLSFGGYGGGVSNFENLNLNYVINSNYRPLLSKIYTTPNFKTAYLQSLCMLQKNYFSTSHLFPIIDTIVNIIRPYVYADPKKQYTNTQFEMNILSDLSIAGVGGTNRIPGIKSFLTARQTNVQTQLTNLSISCGLQVNRGDVVINEFLASNSTIPDPHGQFGDWIELYNNTDANIDLSGMYLTDNFSSPTKWQFPANSIIAAKNYLMVWADDGAGTIGLHANFKLSADGEQIRLSNIDASILDTVSFGVQLANLSMARKPNGTGQFLQGTPTPNSNNDGTSIIEIDGNGENLDFGMKQNYPNPFNPITNIEFTIPLSGLVKLTVFDVLGREIKNLINTYKEKGNYSVKFDASNLSSGIYFYQLSLNKLVQTKSMIVTK
jgi:hypothetical protein